MYIVFILQYETAKKKNCLIVCIKPESQASF